MDEILQKAAENMGMPPALTERSARARAEKEGTTVEAVLAEWAGEEAPPAGTPADAEALESPNEGAASPPAATSAPDPSPTPDAAPGAATEVTTEYLVALAAEAKRMPEKLVRSSAEARARNSKADLDVVLATWAGVDLDELHAKADAGEPLPAVTTEEAAAPPPEPAAAPEVAESTTAAADPQPAAAATAGAVAALSAEELLEQAAAAKGMPASIAKRSAEARAKSEGTSLEAVLADWAGVDPATVGSATASPAPEPSPAADPAPAAAPGAAAATISADELLEQAAAAKGMPASIAKRSAEARAKSEGTSLEAVLADWAGVDPATVGSATASPAPEPAAEAPPAPTPEPEATPGDDVEVIAPAEPESAGEPIDVDEVPVAAVRGGYPAWLAAAFVIIPLLAVTYILVAPNGPDCGTAGQLDIDPVTGLAVNCDGSEYGGSSVDFFAQGAGIYNQCAACHGSGGEGAGSFPAFTGGALLTLFPAGQCSAHIEWVALGTANFPEPTYGATNKPVGGSGAVMPGYVDTLTAEEIAAVSLYERVAFGGQDLEAAEIDCGLVAPEGEEPAEGDTEDGDAEEMVDASGG